VRTPPARLQGAPDDETGNGNSFPEKNKLVEPLVFSALEPRQAGESNAGEPVSQESTICRMQRASGVAHG
jgi:hypothetical protein